MTDDTLDEATVETTTNLCEADQERRRHAMADNTLTERFGDMARSITFQVGFDHRAFPDDCGNGGHGQHGMEMTWFLSGPHGVVQWKVFLTNWVPGNVRYGNVDSLSPTSLYVPNNSQVGDGMAADLGFHSPVPQYSGQDRMECHLLPEGYCYYDGSGLNAEPVLLAFLNHGPHGVWAALGRYYGELFVSGERK